MGCGRAIQGGERLLTEAEAAASVKQCEQVIDWKGETGWAKVKSLCDDNHACHTTIGVH